MKIRAIRAARPPQLILNIDSRIGESMAAVRLPQYRVAVVQVRFIFVAHFRVFPKSRADT
jgi:hypothetical protein